MSAPKPPVKPLESPDFLNIACPWCENTHVLGNVPEIVKRVYSRVALKFTCENEGCKKEFSVEGTVNVNLSVKRLEPFVTDDSEPIDIKLLV